MRIQHTIFAAALVTSALIAGCGGGGSSTPPAPVPTQTVAPTAAPTVAPTVAPTIAPTVAPTLAPTPTPTVAPTFTPLPTASPGPTAAPTAVPTYLPGTVQPIFDCVGHTGSAFYMLFGYNNPTGTTVDIAAGTTNNEMLLLLTSGNVPYTGQPSTFNPGLHDRLFQVPLTTGEVSVQWTLDGNTIGPIPKEGSTSC